jgi:hypothetical protein
MNCPGLYKNMKSTTQQQASNRPVWSSSCVILPSDFSNSFSDPVRDQWNAGKLRHVIAALNGSPVAVVTDNGTGHTEIGVSLVGFTSNSYVDLVVVERTLSDGKITKTAYNPWKLGVILPLAEAMGATGAKWRSLELHRNELSAAVRIFQKTPPEGAVRYEAASGRDYAVVSAYDANGRSLAFRKFRLEELS